jgi:hypothetical protein
MNLEREFIMQGPNRNISRSIKRGLAGAEYLGIQILQNPVTPKKAPSCFMVWERIESITHDSGSGSVPLRPHLGR